MKSELASVAAHLRGARRILFITGAGVSAESGIGTFRGRTALFVNGLTEDGVPFEEALSSSAFWRNPERGWKRFFQLEQAVRGKQPNPAHRAMAALENEERFVCIATQNIDGLHQRAGSRRVIELHGNLLHVLCTECDYEVTVETFEAFPALPRCPECGQLMRPDIVLYEEALPEAALSRFHSEQQLGFDLVFSVGTTSVFNYVVLPVLLAARQGIPTVEINPEPTPISDLVAYRFSEPAGEMLEKLMAAVNTG